MHKQQGASGADVHHALQLYPLCCVACVCVWRGRGGGDYAAGSFTVCAAFRQPSVGSRLHPLPLPLPIPIHHAPHMYF